LLPACLWLTLAALRGWAPFGPHSVVLADMRNQYISFFAYLQGVLRGQNSLLYSLAKSPGGNMWDLAATYLFSPVNLLAGLFPAARLPEALLCVVTLKTGLCGLTCALFLCARAEDGPPFATPVTVALSTAYALSGYTTRYFSNVMWLDGVILLPLVALGLRRLFAGRSPWLYLFSLAGALITHYYIGYMLCLFSALAFALGCLAGAPRRHTLAWLGRRAGLFTLASLGAAGLAAFVLLPVFASLSSDSKASLGVLQSLAALRGTDGAPRLGILSGLLTVPLATEQDAFPAIPALFCGAGTTALTGLYFLNTQIRWREKLAAALLLFALITSFHDPGLNLIWHGFNSPMGFPYRNAFLFPFCAVALAGRCWARRGGTRRWHGLAIAVAFAGLALLIARREGFDAAALPWRALDVALVAGCCLLITCGKRRPACGDPAPRARAVAAWGLALILCAHLLLQGELTIRRIQAGTFQMNRAAIANRITQNTALAQAIRDRDGGLYRMELPLLNADDSLALGYPGLSNFSSVARQGPLALFGALGYSSNGISTILYSPHTGIAADSLLGLRYLALENTPPQTDWRPLFTQGKATVYENPYALPLVFAADAEVMRACLPTDTPFEAVNRLYSAILGEETTILRPLTGDVTPSNARPAPLGDGTVYHRQDKAAPAAITAAARDAAAGPVYVDIEVSGMGQPARVSAGGQDMGNFYSYHRHNLFALGETTDVTVRFESDYLRIARFQFAQQDTQALARAVEMIREGGAQMRLLSGSHLAGTVHVPPGKTALLCTFPYDEGWRARVDGKDVAPLLSLAASPMRAGGEPGAPLPSLMVIPITPGIHALDLRYTPPGLAAGAWVSLATAALIAGIAVWRKARRRPLAVAKPMAD
jgi:uncharacterized membrane protein YfhO